MPVTLCYVCAAISPMCECASLEATVSKTRTLIEAADLLLGPVPVDLPPIISDDTRMEMDDMMKILQLVPRSWTPGNHYYICRIQDCDGFASPPPGVSLFPGAALVATNIGIMSIRDYSTYHYLEEAAIDDARRVNLGTDRFGDDGYGCILIVHVTSAGSILYTRRVIFAVPTGPVTPETLLAAIV